MEQSTLPTEILFILDRSGSMSSIKTSVEAGVAAFIRKNRELGGVCRATLVQFDSDHKDHMQLDTVYESCPLEEVPEFTLAYRGGTPLYDAVGLTLSRYEEMWAKSPNRPGKVIVMVLTDGGDTCSKELNAAGVESIVTRLQKDYGWEINYVGANQDAAKTAKSLGIHASRAATYSTSAHEVAAAFEAMAEVSYESRLGIDTSAGPSLQARYQTKVSRGLSHQAKVTVGTADLASLLDPKK